MFLELRTKPDLDRAIDVWMHYWNGEIPDRPIVIAEVPKPGKERIDPHYMRYANAISGNYQTQMDHLEYWLEKMLFMGEAIPHFSPDHGPDQFTAFLGFELRFAADNPSTTWCETCVDDWETFLPIELDDIDQTRLEDSLKMAQNLNHNNNSDRALITAHCGVENRRDALKDAKVSKKLRFYSHYPEVGGSRLLI